MSDDLDRLAARVGIEPRYETLAGDIHAVSEEAKSATLQVMGIPAGTPLEIDLGLATIPAVEHDAMQAPGGATCFVPAWLKESRCWGVSCQLYGLRSERNWGIGDFEDLARFAEIAAAAGADFVGVNPLHALFVAMPERSSPFYPSNRQFLNPLYIAIENIPGYQRLADALVPPPDIRASELMDYRAVAELKLKALDRLFRIFEEAEEDAESEAFESFCAARGQPLYHHAQFETLSDVMVQQGHGATWHGWPEDFRGPASDKVRAFAEEHAELVTFHCWLQWIAERQLSEAQARAIRAGMRIGLYLDLAVGVAPDGSATWSDPELIVPGARIGAPPDYFNSAGQDWGLAPLSPAALVSRDFEPFREAMDRVVSSSGALRIDHAMSLYRLFWIAQGFSAADGVYVRYPFKRMLSTLAEVSQQRRTIVIGEDLGVVPAGFRDVMKAMEIQGYRVFFFEKKEDVFVPPQLYPREALACITTHDLHTLAGWWSGHDLEVRRDIGMIDAGAAEAQLADRANERRRVLGLLEEYDLLPAELAAIMRGEAEPARDMPASFAVALHRLVARTPSRLFVVPAEDFTASVEQVNIPGTMDEHPNWRRKLGVSLEDLAAAPLLRAITQALREERPKPA